MKKGIIKMLSIIMILILSFSITPLCSYANVQTTYLSVENGKKYDNSTETLTTDDTMKLADTSSSAPSYSSYDSAINYFQTNAAKRIQSISFNLYTNDSSININSVYNDAVSEEYATKSTYGDYLRWSIAGEKSSGQSKPYTVNNSKGKYYITFVYTLYYYDTASQETAANTATAKALASLNCSSSSDYDKVWSVYNYISNKADYVSDENYSNVSHSAYSAIVLGETVCQGFAVELYRMLKELGVDNRVIVSDTHAWNIVEIDGVYYNVDLTWDDETKDGYNYDYFLKTNYEFDRIASHERLSEYESTEFEREYPVSTTDYKYRKNVATYVTTSSISNVCYTGSAIKPSIKVDTSVLSSGDYSTTYSNNINYGYASAKVSGTGNYTGYAVRNYKIVCKTHSIKTITTKATTTSNGKVEKYCPVCDTTISSTTIKKASSIKLTSSSYCYNGNVRKPSFVVKDSSGNKLVKGKDYEIKYSNSKSKSIGVYYIRINFKGNYSGTKKYSYKITPKKVKITKLSTGLRKFRVTWSRTKYSTGYQIQYSTSKSFPSSSTTSSTIKDNTVTTKRFIDLKAKKTYYVRVRVYKIVNDTKIYGPWSDIKSVKTK